MSTATVRGRGTRFQLVRHAEMTNQEYEDEDAKGGQFVFSVAAVVDLICSKTKLQMPRL